MYMHICVSTCHVRLCVYMGVGTGFIHASIKLMLLRFLTCAPRRSIEIHFFGQPGSVSKFPPFLCVNLWVGWVGRGYIEISRYFPALWINRVTLVTKIKLWYSLGY